MRKLKRYRVRDSRNKLRHGDLGTVSATSAKAAAAAMARAFGYHSTPTWMVADRVAEKSLFDLPNFFG